MDFKVGDRLRKKSSRHSKNKITIECITDTNRGLYYDIKEETSTGGLLYYISHSRVEEQFEKINTKKR